MEYTAPGSGFQYPTPLELARRRKVAEEQRLYPSIRVTDDPAKADEWYSELCRHWGRLGGLTTSARYGSIWFRNLAMFRNGKINREKFERNKATLIYRYQDECNGTIPPRSNPRLEGVQQ